MESEQFLFAAEKKYKQNLENFISGIFRESFLPSHGPGHHSRVWKYACELAQANLFPVPDEQSAVKLLIACYLHDAGMAYERGEKHGKRSMELCRIFLRENHLPDNDYEDVLGAIENHDNKDYTAISDSSPLRLILGIADDLDAFGFIGIYRYIEIYLERNIPLNQLSEKIRINAASRFENFRKHCSRSPVLLNRHSKRYSILENFCHNYAMESARYIFGTDSPEGFCGIAEIIGDMLKQKLYPGAEMNRYVTERGYKDPVILWFSGELEKETAGAI
ncbi:MAG: HD domain-containing protein [Bacteroidales bacterium]|nr:HD domain-containing protein [Bacteroidales bacterium]